MTMAGIEISMARISGVPVARLVGDLDLANVASIAADLADRRVGLASFVVDLTAVGYLDSSGLRLLNDLRRSCDDDRTLLRVIAPPGSPSALAFRFSGFPGEVVVESFDDAQRAITGDAPEP